MGSPEDRTVASELFRNAISSTGHRFAVTGASGWLGHTALALLAQAMPPCVFQTRVRAYASQQKTIRLSDGFVVEARPLEDLKEEADDKTFLLHFAYLTRERAVEGLEHYVASNCAITAEILAAVERGIAGIFVPSSGAVYEKDGSLTTDLAGNPYGVLKHLDELIFSEATRKTGAACVIARIFALGGRAMTKPHLYALGDLVLRAIAGEALEIRARHRVVRSYASADDVVTLGTMAVLGGAGGAPIVFDTAGEVLELGELAEQVRSVLGRPQLPIVRPELDPAASEDRYVGDRRSMQALADRFHLAPADTSEIIADTARGLTTRV